MAITIRPDSPLKVTTTEDKKTIEINKSDNSVNLTTETTSVVSVTAPGPRGQKGDTGDTGAQGPQGISGFSGSAESSSISTRLTTAESELGNTLISSSAQIASDISGSFTNLSSSLSTRLTTDETNITNLQTDSGSFSTRITTAETELSNTIISSSAQIASDISGSFGNQRVGTTDDVDFASVTTTGNVSVGGNLDVSGTTTSIDSATLNIGDKNITIGSGSATSVQLDGGGIDFGLGGTIANLRYRHSDTSITSSVDFRAPNFYGIFNGALSSSAQIASNISGSFTAASSSFSTRITTAETELGNTLISSSAQVDLSQATGTAANATNAVNADNIALSADSTNTNRYVPFTSTADGDGELRTDAGLVYNPSTNTITTTTFNGDLSGNATTATTATNVAFSGITGKPTLLSGSAQIADDISGSFTSGFEFTGTISGSSTSTGSFGHLIGGQTATINGFTFPTTDGTDGQAIVTDGSGALTFDDIKSVAIVKNISGVTLQKGTPVHATGSVGNTPTVIAASASDATTMPATFVLDEQLVDDAEGRALLSGFINGVNTAGFVEGGIVYVGENGGYTQTKPTGTNLIQNLGIVTKIDSSNGSGYIYGSGRSNDVPNLLDNTIFYGSGSNQMQQIHISGALQDTNLGYAIFNDRVEASSFTGSLLSTNGVLSGSAQIASDISGSFTAGTGLDLSSGEFSVDVSDFMSNGVDNRVLTATGTDAFNAEANLTFDGNVLEVTHISASGNISGSEGRFSGDVIAFYSSDKRLKDNIIPISNPIEKIKSIGGYEFDWNNNQSTYEGHDIGVIAQEIEDVLPELVTTRNTGYKAVKYEKIIALLIEAIKEQQKQIDELKNKS